MTAARTMRAAVLLAALGCGRENNPPPPDLPAVGGQVSLFGFPRSGGPIQVFQPDSLTLLSWTTLQPLPPIRRVFGADLDERVIWLLDAQGNVVSLDLESRAVRKVIDSISTGAMGPDGSLYLTDAKRRIVHLVRRQPVRFHDPLPGSPRALFGALNDQLVAVTGGPPFKLIATHTDQSVYSTPVPPGETAATPWGDLVAIAADSAVLLYETGGQRKQTSVTGLQHARRVAFSPSGHHLYVTQDNSEIKVFDRFSLAELPPILLPSLPREFRVDASGRWLLVHPAVGDSIWVVDLATNKLAASVPGGWAADLPLVAGAATLVVRSVNRLSVFDLLQAPPRRVGTLEGGGGFVWLAAAWVPPERLPAAVAAAESATVVQDSALRVDSLLTQPDSNAIYLQVSRTQNPEWADLLTKQLKTDGYPASILKPNQPEDGYRVVVGPYLTRELAESTGKLLGRAYFILKLPAKHP